MQRMPHPDGPHRLRARALRRARQVAGDRPGTAHRCHRNVARGQDVRRRARAQRGYQSDPRFVDCATRKLFTYALGRVPGAADEQRIKGLVDAFGKGDYQLEGLIVSIIASDAFRMRQGGT